MFGPIIPQFVFWLSWYYDKLIETICFFIVPVSYTHLDVYKRQLWKRGGHIFSHTKTCVFYILMLSPNNMQCHYAGSLKPKNSDKPMSACKVCFGGFYGAGNNNFTRCLLWNTFKAEEYNSEPAKWNALIRKFSYSNCPVKILSPVSLSSVSYTHLDVYKRQGLES